jgi:hypothetical protein
MNLVYLLSSLAGVGLIVLLNVALFGRAERSVDADAAKALLAEEYPGFVARRIALASDGRGALVEDVPGALYLVLPSGSALVSRELSAGLLCAVESDGATLALRLRDLTFPRARLHFGEEAEAEEWKSRLAPLIAARGSK